MTYEAHLLDGSFQGKTLRFQHEPPRELAITEERPEAFFSGPPVRRKPRPAVYRAVDAAWPRWGSPTIYYREVLAV